MPIDLSVSRRGFLRAAALLSPVLLGSNAFSMGRLPFPFIQHPPVPFPHFPSRLHAFVWRNWNLVPLARMASILGASESQLLKLGQAIGLDRPKPVSDEQWRRSYVTIIRRNWHLLPKTQLEALLGWTAEQMEFTLQEDDFLNVKLGNLKPDCELLTWSSSTDKSAENWIREVVKQEFSELQITREEPLFQFVKDLSAAPKHRTETLASNFSPRFGYGYFTLFGDPLLDTDLDPYPDGYLQRMAATGLDGTWMHIVLSNLTPFPWDPAVSKGWETRLANLKKLIEKCKRQGIGIYLYLNEPRRQPLSFFEKHPELKGVTSGQHAALCTSHPDVQNYLENAIAQIVSAVPDLAGFFTISASENPTHCWSHFKGDTCPRCASKGPEAVIVELHRVYESGIRKGMERYRKEVGDYKGPGPQLILWDWAWPDGWAENIIPKLPSNISYMCVSEWSLPINRGGVESKVGEYSISAIGPGPRAKRHWAIAREHGLRILAKIQAGTTWECGGVPYIPALENVAQHIVNLRDEKVSGLLTGWTLGGYPGSPNLEVVSVIGSDDRISVRDALTQVAKRRYGAAAEDMVDAWYGFSKAFREFPYHIGVVYQAPVHSGPANLLWKEATGYSSTMVGIGYDDLKGWRSIYPEEVFINQLYQVAEGFDRSLATLNERTKSLTLTKEERLEFERELSIAEAVAILYRSVANQADFIRHRDQLGTVADRSGAKSRLRELLLSEIKLARRLYELQSADSRIGFEATNHYFYVPDDLMEKVLNCRYLLENWVEKI